MTPSICRPYKSRRHNPCTSSKRTRCQQHRRVPAYRITETEACRSPTHRSVLRTVCDISRPGCGISLANSRCIGMYRRSRRKGGAEGRNPKDSGNTPSPYNRSTSESSWRRGSGCRLPRCIAESVPTQRGESFVKSPGPPSFFARTLIAVSPRAHSSHRRIGCTQSELGHPSKAFFSQRQQYTSEHSGQTDPLSALTVPKQRTQFCFFLPLLTTMAPPEVPPPEGASDEAAAPAFALALAALDFLPIAYPAVSPAVGR